MMVPVHISARPMVSRFRLRSATPELPAPLEMPPPNMSDRPPPRPLCSSTSTTTRKLVSTSRTSRMMRSASNGRPYVSDLPRRVAHARSRIGDARGVRRTPVSYTHLRAHETVLDLVCRLLL